MPDFESASADKRTYRSRGWSAYVSGWRLECSRVLQYARRRRKLASRRSAVSAVSGDVDYDDVDDDVCV